MLKLFLIYEISVANSFCPNMKLHLWNLFWTKRLLKKIIYPKNSLVVKDKC